MNLLHEIKKQPEHIKGIFVWLCVVITFSLVSFVWFRSTQRRFVALLHPERIEEQIRLAQGIEKAPSPLQGLANSFSILRASLGELFAGQKMFDPQDLSEDNQPEMRPGLLPVVKER